VSINIFILMWTQPCQVSLHLLYGHPTARRLVPTHAFISYKIIVNEIPKIIQTIYIFKILIYSRKKTKFKKKFSIWVLSSLFGFTVLYSDVEGGEEVRALVDDVGELVAAEPLVPVKIRLIQHLYTYTTNRNFFFNHL